MLTCFRNRKRLGAYWDGELSDTEMMSVERHLEKCESCRAFLSDLEKLEQLLLALEAPSAPDNLISRIEAEVHARKRPKIGAGLPGLSRRRWITQNWAAKGVTVAALIVGMVMGSYMGWASYRDDGPAQPQPADPWYEPLYSLDMLGAAPEGSIEAAILTLLEKEK